MNATGQELDDGTVVTALSEQKTDEAAWQERGQVLLEQVEAICRRGRQRELSYMQTIYELENLRIAEHLESRPKLTSLAASRSVIQYQSLMKLLDAGRALPGWGETHEALMVEALDIAFFRMSDHEHELYERKVAEEKAGGYIADCSDPYYGQEFGQLAAIALQNAEIARRPLEAIFIMGFYPCPKDSTHRGHAPAAALTASDEPMPPDRVQFLAERLHAFAADLEAQLAELDVSPDHQALVVEELERQTAEKHGVLCECDQCMHGGTTRPVDHFTLKVQAQTEPAPDSEPGWPGRCEKCRQPNSYDTGLDGASIWCSNPNCPEAPPEGWEPNG